MKKVGMNRYPVNATSTKVGFLKVDLKAVENFPVRLSGAELWDEVVKAVGEERARDYCFRAWTSLKPGGDHVVTRGGYSSEEGQFLGYARGVVVSPGGPACIWGDSDAPNAEFVHVSEHARDCIFAVCRTTSWKGNPVFWLSVVHDQGEQELAEALGVTLDELIIAA